MELHAIYRDGTTFGMEVSSTHAAYKRLLRNVTVRNVVGRFGQIKKAKCVRADDLADLMNVAGWLIRERRGIVEVSFDEGEMYRVLYPAEGDECLRYMR